MTPEPHLVGAVEALLFAAGAPVAIEALCDALDGAEPAEVRAAIDAVAARHAGADAGLEVVEVAAGWQMRTRVTYAGPVLRLRGGKPQKLSRAALEVLAICAYRQPVTRQDIEEIRGVDSGGVLKMLLDRGLVRVSGRREEPGRPLEYGTTPQFLELFQLPSLSALPTLKEREELLTDVAAPDEARPEPVAPLDGDGDGGT